MDNQQNYMQQQVKKKKNPIIIILIVLLTCGNIALGILFAIKCQKLDEAKEEIEKKQIACDDMQTEYDNLLLEKMQAETDYDNLSADYDALSTDYQELLSQLEPDTTEYVDTSGMDTSVFRDDVSYDDIARKPDDYEGELLTFKGKVVQVLEGDDTVNLRVAVNGDYDDMLYVVYDKRILDSRLLEDDNITLYGESCGITSYESTLGGIISIPTMAAYKIELQ